MLNHFSKSEKAMKNPWNLTIPGIFLAVPNTFDARRRRVLIRRKI